MKNQLKNGDLVKIFPVYCSLEEFEKGDYKIRNVVNQFGSIYNLTFNKFIDNVCRYRYERF